MSFDDCIYCDTHAHLSDEAFDSDRLAVAENALAQGLDFIIDVGTNKTTWKVSRELSSSVDRIFTTVGWHPHDASDVELSVLSQEFKEWATEKTVAVGEIGLDYHYDFSPRKAQKEVFEAQLQLANEYDLPAVIHIRESWKDAFDILSSVRLNRSGVVHCFSGNYEQACTLLDLGLYLSFTGVLAFPRSTELRDVIKRIPLDRMFFETDCPYLSPPPQRGKRNVPQNVTHIVEVAARELNMTPESLATRSTCTSLTFFGIEKR